MSPAPSKPLQPLPENVEVLTESDAIVLRRKWRSAAAYFLAVFAVIWNGFMVVWMTIALSTGVGMMAAVGSLHAVVGLWLAYFAAASFLNHTDIRIDTRQLSVRHAPLPWFGGRFIPIQSINQLFCRKRVRHTKNGTRTTYELVCIDHRNRQVCLLRGLPTPEQARFIEREIEKILGVPDAPVADELEKSEPDR